MNRWYACLVGGLLLSASLSASAATITVNSLSDSSFTDGDGECTLREAIDNANLDADLTGGDCAAGDSDDVIEFSVTGTLTLNGTQLPIINTVILFQGPGADQLTIDANGQSRILSIDSTVVVIHDLTMTGGVGGNGLATETDFRGGAILIEGGELSLADIILTDNHTTADGAGGGAVLALDADLGIFDSLVSDNSVAGSFAGGGAILHGDDVPGDVRLTIRNSQFTNNHTSGHGGFGGAVFSSGLQQADIIGSHFHNNRTEGPSAAGGAVYILATDFVNIKDSRFEQNETQDSQGGGGALWARVLQSMSIQGSHFIENRTTGPNANGGALGCRGGSADLELTISDSRFIDNRTEGFDAVGGAIDCHGDKAPIIIRHSLLKGNQTEGDEAVGGAIYAEGEIHIRNSRLENNRTRGESAPGGGIGLVDANLTLTESQILDNLTEDDFSPGGGINAGSSQLLITMSSLMNNQTQGDQSRGGALNAEGNPLTVRTSLFSGNQTKGNLSAGGALHVDSGLTLVNSTLSENSVNNSSGGGLFIGGNEAVVTHTSFVNNEAGGDSEGGGILMIGQLMLNNSLLTGNSPDNCQTTTAGGFKPPSENNLADDTSCAAAQLNASVGDPAFLGILADNGGPTLTHALFQGSPAIDEAGPVACADMSVKGIDQRGAERPESDRADCDVGAFEFGHQVLEAVNESDSNINASVNDTDVLALAFSLYKRFPAGDDVDLGHFVFRQCFDNTLRAGDIDRLALWRDGGDEEFDAGQGDDVLIDDDASGPGPNGTFFFDPPEAGAGLSDVVDDNTPESRYYVSLDIDGDLFALNQVLPGWSQTAYAAAGHSHRTLSLASWLTLFLAGLFVCGLFFRSRFAHGLRVFLLAAFTAFALTACPNDGGGGNGGGNNGGNDGGGGGSSISPNPPPTEAGFCLSLLSVEARTADAAQQTVPVAGLPLDGSQVNVSE